MIMTYEEVVSSAVNDGLMECAETFSQALQNFSADLVRAFDYGADSRLQDLDYENEHTDLGLDMETVREGLNRCRKIFIKRIDDALQEALCKAEGSFEKLLEPIADEMASRLEDYSQVVNL